MADIFGDHRLKIPYQPIADLLAGYRRRDPDKLAIVDLDQDTSISFGALEAAVTDTAAALNKRASARAPGFCCSPTSACEKLLIWLATWRLGAVVCPAQYRAERKADRATWRRQSIRCSRWCTGSRWRRAAGRQVVYSVWRLQRRMRPAPIRRTTSFARWRATSSQKACRSATRPPT